MTVIPCILKLLSIKYAGRLKYCSYECVKRRTMVVEKEEGLYVCPKGANAR